MFSKNKNIKCLLYAIDVFTKYGLNLQKIKRGKPVLNAFIEIAIESNRKSCVNQGMEFYNKLMQEWLENNHILMYSSKNEEKSVIAERFIKTLKSIKKWQLMIANLIFLISID